MKKKIIVTSIILIFIFISNVSANEIKETMTTIENENSCQLDFNHENNMRNNSGLDNTSYNSNQNFQEISHKFIKLANNSNVVFKDVSNQKTFINENECFNVISDENLVNNSNYELYYGIDKITNKTYLIVNEIQNNNNQENSILTGHDVAFFYKNGKYSTYLKDVYGNPLDNERIIFNINGVGYSRVTDDNGYAYLNINLWAGNYTITALFTGNSQYKSSIITNKIYIISTILSNNLIKSYMNDSQFNAMVFDGAGNRLKNSIVTFNINGILYNRTTDKTGVAQININLNPGKYIITVTNSNDQLSESYNITVLKQNIIITYDKFVINRKGEYFITKVTDTSGNPLTKFNINIVANGVSYTRTTDAKGIAKLKINFETGNYNIYCTFYGTYQYNSFYGSSKSITMLSSSTKLNVNLNTNNTIFRDKGYSFNALLKDNNGFPMSGKTIIFQINGNSYSKITDENGIAKQSINLNHGQYSISTIYSDSTYYNSITKNNIIKMNLTPNMVYSVDIPMYFNVSGLDYVTGRYLTGYVAKFGVGDGIVKVYQTREIIINTKQTHAFAYGNLSFQYDENHTKLNINDVYFISKEGQRTKVNNQYVPTEQGILIKAEKDFIKFYYYDTLNKNDINQFSTLFHSFLETNYELQLITFIKNLKSWCNILYTNSVYNDDLGLKLELSGWKSTFQGIPLKDISYNQLLYGDLDKLKYTNTNTSLQYSNNTMQIIKNPYFENMYTEFKIDDEIIKKTEKISPYWSDLQAGFSTIQTYTITDKKISNDDIKYWLNKNYTVGSLKAAYGTFLNGLMTTYMHDNLANEKDNLYNLTWTRNQNTIVMSGVMSEGMQGGTSYIHIPNPSMNMKISCNNDENIKNFRFECSIMLSEMENIALGLSNLNSFGSLSSLTAHILGGDWFSVEQKNGSLCVDLKDYSDKLIINQSTGIVCVTTELDGFSYKGALSSDYSYCFCDGLTNNTQNNAKKVYEIYVVNNSQTNINNRFNEGGNSFTITEEQWEAFEFTAGVFADFSIEASAMCIASAARYPVLAKPLLGSALIFGLGGLGLNCLSNGILRDPTGKTFYKSLTDTGEGYVSSFTGVPLP
jgi:hypothetical protein